MSREAVVQDHRSWRRSFSLQNLVCLTFGKVLPPLIYFSFDVDALVDDEPAINSLTSLVAAVVGLFLAAPLLISTRVRFSRCITNSKSLLR